MHPVADCINVNEKIWDVYLNQLIPLVAVEGDDGNYALTAAADIQFLQVINSVSQLSLRLIPKPMKLE